MRKPILALSAAALSAVALPLLAADWPTWGRDATRNLVSPETNLPDTVNAGKIVEDTGEIDLATTKHVAWAAKMGSYTYGNPVIANGKVYVGTNNHSPRDPKYEGDRGVLLALDEKTGKMIWQYVVPKLLAGRNLDWEDCGICSSPAVDGNRLYVVNNRCEVVALDVDGLANGNDGVADEAKAAEVADVSPTDADVIWRFDLRHELGVVPHFQAAANPLVVGDRVYVCTSNGVDWSDKHIPSPAAPALVCFDKKTGKLIGQERLGISARTFYCNWSSPAFGDVGGKPTIVFGGGDGFVYGFDPAPSPDGSLVELWRVDANPPEYRKGEDGKPIKYRDGKGPSEVIATPAIHGGRVYVPIGQDPEHGAGSGAMNCVAVDYKDGKATASIAWQNKNVQRSMSTPAIVDGMVFVPDMAGFVHCLDAATGKAFWRRDVQSVVWGGALVADGKAYLGNESGELVILTAGKQDRPLTPKPIDMLGPIFSTPVAANGAVYVAAGTHLFKLVK